MKSATNINTNEPKDGTRAYTLEEAFRRLAVGYVTGHRLVGSGQLESFRIGRRRYITEDSLRCFIAARLEEAKLETPEQRAAKVRLATAASLEARKARG